MSQNLEFESPAYPDRRSTAGERRSSNAGSLPTARTNCRPRPASWPGVDNYKRAHVAASLRTRK